MDPFIWIVLNFGYKSIMFHHSINCDHLLSFCHFSPQTSFLFDSSLTLRHQQIICYFMLLGQWSLKKLQKCQKLWFRWNFIFTCSFQSLFWSRLWFFSISLIHEQFLKFIKSNQLMTDYAPARWNQALW